MKDFFEAFQKVSELHSPFLTIGALLLLIGYWLWQNYFSERARLENQRRRIEVIRLAIELDNLHKTNPSLPLSGAIESVLKEISIPKSTRFAATLRSLHDPLGWISRFFSRQPRWLRLMILSFIGAFVTSCIFLVIILAQLSQGTNAGTLWAMVFIVASVGCIAAVVTGVLFGAFLKRFDPTGVFYIASVLTVLLMPVGGYAANLGLHIYAVVRSAR